jgi:hypothetical protein
MQKYGVPQSNALRFSPNVHSQLGINSMGRRSLNRPEAETLFADTLFADTLDTLERLIMENTELRQTAAELALQTAILRESLDGAKLIRRRLRVVA